jgi:hypothetical protein
LEVDKLKSKSGLLDIGKIRLQAYKVPGNNNVADGASISAYDIENNKFMGNVMVRGSKGTNPPEAYFNIAGEKVFRYV